MSWRSGSSLFIEIWPLLQRHIPEQDLRVGFTTEMLKIFVQDDMDPWEVEDVHFEIREALKQAGIGLQEPERWSNDPPLEN